MYALLKTLHILSSTVLFGTGLGTAFFMWMASRSGNRHAMALVSGHVMKADLYFTAPSVVLQPLSGFGLMWMSGYSLHMAPMNWLGLSLLLYLVAGGCWLPVLGLQRRMHEIAAAYPEDSTVPAEYWKLFRWWTALGVPAFFSLVVVFWLMVAKPF